jgi:hypothetical protein
MEDGVLFDLFGSLSREIGDLRVEMKEGFNRFDGLFNRLETSQARTEATLRRAIRLAVRDARRQRERNAEFDKRHLEAEAQMQELRLMMKAFLDRGGNGSH